MEVNLNTRPKFSDKRDAIHCAIIPVEAGENLRPGDKVEVIDGKAYLAKVDYDGVVNPFGSEAYRSYLFWMFLKPNTVRDMTHQWVSDKFPLDSKASFSKEESEEWLETFCRTSNCPDLDTVMSAIKGTLSSRDEDYGYSSMYDEEYLMFFGWDASGAIPNEFWDHVENVLGEKVPYRSQYFSCSC